MNQNGHGELKLNIGSGDALTLKGYVNVDAKFGGIAFPLQFPENSADEIYASHVLEHFPHVRTLEVLKDWARVLKPGGWIKIAVPDFKFIAEAYLRGHANDMPLQGYLMGGQVDEHDFHSAIFDKSTLERLMTEAGLEHIEPWQSEIKDCASLPVSLNLMGRKPLPVGPIVEASNGRQFVAGQWRDESQLIKDSTNIRTGVVMSTPRYGPLDAADCIFEIATHLAAPRFRSAGAWWEQGLTRSIEHALDYKNPAGNPLDVIVTVDYDTFATPDDSKRLIRLLYQNPQYDCIVPTQARRGAFQEVLARTAGPVDVTQGLVPIVTGHFGLTVFRRRVFEQLKKPWFWGKPDDDGRWDEGRTDADIWFWNTFADQGFKAALATRVVIGHGEDAVAYPRIVDGKVEKVYVSVFEWLGGKRKPAQAGLIEVRQVVDSAAARAGCGED